MGDVQDFYNRPRRPRPPRQLVFRNVENGTVYGGAGFTFFVFAVVVLLIERTPTSFTMSAACLVVFIFATTRLVPQGIYVDEEGVTVKGAFRERRLSWSDIGKFELRRTSMGFWGWITYLDLIDGSSFPASSLNAGHGLLPSMNRRAQVQVAELNRLLAEHTKR